MGGGCKLGYRFSLGALLSKGLPATLCSLGDSAGAGGVGRGRAVDPAVSTHCSWPQFPLGNILGRFH